MDKASNKKWPELDKILVDPDSTDELLGLKVKVLPDSNEQSLQHFLSNSPWDYRAVMDQMALDVDAELGDHQDTMLMIDESGLLMGPLVRRSWQPRGRTPILHKVSK